MHVLSTRARRRRPRENVTVLACCALVSAAVLLGVMTPVAALADGDPASDVLLAQNAYYPYQPTVSPGLEATLNKLLGTAEHSSLPLKVAVIGSEGDLGLDPTFFGHPQPYAQFLEREISFNDHPPVLVVMSNGFGVADAGPAKSLAAIKIDARHGTDGLVRSAIAAVVALLHEAGRTVKPSVPVANASGSGPPPVALFALPVGLLIVVGMFALLRDRQARERRRADAAGEAKEVSGSR